MNEETLFQEALSRSREERAAFLGQACSGRPELRAAVEALLAAYEKSANILDKPPVTLGLTVDSSPVESRGPDEKDTPENANSIPGTLEYQPQVAPGIVIAGRYVLQEKIGEGGMGEVWVARQTEPVKRKVALKLIKTGMDSRAVLQRFEQERQALAMMDHPHIAKVLDGGLTPSGQPFFVMELVNGLALVRFCDEARLTTKQRLELFVPICQAVQHAHQKGIVHRDLKPANILVTLVDGRPVPKVIDFGVAKATAGKLTDESLSTQFGAVVGTLEYMSPEQAGFSSDDIDTRADIYSLGVILYELLTGLRPIDAKRLRKAALTEMIRIIREEEPSKPSTRLSTDDSAASAAALRQIEPKRLMALLRGDLDWVVMKCLEKSRERRYETANGLARDVQRFLDGDPVEACPPSASYRLRKFARKHRATLATIGAFAVLLLVASVVSTALAVAASRARDDARNALDDTRKEKQKTEEALAQAKAVSTFLVGTFRSPDPYQDGRSVKVVDMLEGASDTLLKEFAGSRETRAALLDALGRTYMGLGIYAKAETLLKDAVTVRSALLGVDHLDTLTSRANLANVYWYQGRYPESIAAHEAVLRVRAARLEHDHPDVLQSRFDLASAYAMVARTREAIAMEEETLKLREARLGPDHVDTLQSRDNLADNYRAAGRLNEAVRLSEETFKLRKSKLGPDHVDTLLSRINVANGYEAVGRITEMIAIQEEALKLAESKLGRDHPITLACRIILARAYRAAGRLEKLIAMEQETLKLHESKLGHDHPNTLASRDNLATDYVVAGRPAEAIRLYEETLKLRESKLEPDHPQTLSTRDNLASAYREVGRLAEAIKLHQEVLTLRESKLGPNHPHTLASRDSLATDYHNAARFDEAIKLQEETLKLQESKLGYDHPSTLASRHNLAVSYIEVGRGAEAIKLHQEVLKLQESKLGHNHPNMLITLSNLATDYRKVGRIAESIKLLEETVPLQESKLGHDHPDTLDSRSGLALSYRDAGRTHEAIAMEEETLKRKESKHGHDHPETLTSRNNLAIYYAGAGRLAQAIAIWEEMLPSQRKVVGPGHPSTLISTNALATTYESLGRWAEAEPLRREILARRREKEKPGSLSTARAFFQLGYNLIKQEKWPEAEVILRECLAICETSLPEDWKRFHAMSLLGAVLMGRHRYEEADSLLIAGYEGMKARATTVPPVDKPFLSEAAQQIVRLYEAWGKPEKAAEWKTKFGLADLPADVFAPG